MAGRKLVELAEHERATAVTDRRRRSDLTLELIQILIALEPTNQRWRERLKENGSADELDRSEYADAPELQHEGFRRRHAINWSGLRDVLRRVLPATRHRQD